MLADEAVANFKDHWTEGPSRDKSMTVALAELIRRFLLYVLPKGFHRPAGKQPNEGRLTIARARE